MLAGFKLAEAQRDMTKGGLPAILRHLRRTVPLEGGDPSASDADLLGRFIHSRDGIAFEALVRRHASMVWNVCRRVLHDEADADDAFQAVFLTLVRKAHTISRRASVACWLHKVASRIAVEARRQAARRATREVPLMEHPLSRPAEDAAWRDLRLVLDEEVCRLPEKYRAPVVLCYLQGHSNVEAARQLGCPSGTVVTRLAWARQRLRKRLTQRGLSASTALLTAVLVQRTEAAVVPQRLIDVTLQTSIRLASGGTAAAGAQAATALQLSRAATGTISAAQIKFAVVLAASLATAGGAAALRGHVPSGDPAPFASATILPRSEATAARPVEQGLNIEKTGNEWAVTPKDERLPRGEDDSRKNKLLGFFERANAAKNTMTFMADDGTAMKSRTLPVAAGASITRNAQPVRLTDLKPGSKLKLWLSEDGSQIIEIRLKDRDFGDLPGKNKTR